MACFSADSSEGNPALAKIVIRSYSFNNGNRRTGVFERSGEVFFSHLPKLIFFSVGLKSLPCLKCFHLFSTLCLCS